MVALVATLVSCASAPVERRAGERGIDGRLSVRYKDLDTGKEDALSGRFEWTERDGAIELALLDPLGQSVALIRAGTGRSTLTFRDGRTVEGDSPEALTREALGWTVPLSGLGRWIDGQPRDAGRAVRLDDHAFREDGWTIRVAQADADAAGPRRIDLSYPGPPVEVELRLVVDLRTSP